MAITWYSQSGQPADSVGVDGDLSWDYGQRMQWGPKGRITAGSWSGTAVANQGPTGPGVLSGTGSPSSNIGQPGNMYVDATQGTTYLKGSSSWSAVGSLPSGPQGAQGFSSLTQFAMGASSYAIANSVTLSSTPQVLTIAGTTIPAYFVPTNASAFLGAYFYQAGSACTVTLYDVTASAAVWSYSLGTSSVGTGVFASTAYPLPANHTYQWQVTGSGTATFQLNPYYLQPTGNNTAGSGILQGFTSATSTTLSSTVQYLGPGPKTSSNANYVRGFGVVRTGAVLSFQGIYLPSTAGAASATATFTLYSYSGSQATIGSLSVTNNGLPQVTTPSSPLTLSTGMNYYIGVTGSGTGQVDCQLNVVV